VPTIAFASGNDFEQFLLNLLGEAPAMNQVPCPFEPARTKVRHQTLSRATPGLKLKVFTTTRAASFSSALMP